MHFVLLIVHENLQEQRSCFSFPSFDIKYWQSAQEMQGKKEMKCFRKLQVAKRKQRCKSQHDSRQFLRCSPFFKLAVFEWHRRWLT
jgi:hypothetical protein